ncbi:MAG: hemerythrin domain-containing protein [Betaproteobacteria bacterium]
MAKPTEAWHAEHVYFRQLLKVLQREVDAFLDTGRPNYALMVDIVSYLRRYTDQYHHRREDVAFLRLAKRCPDMDMLLARLGQEHRVLAHAGEKFLHLLNDAISGTAFRPAEVEAAGATYLVYYKNHINKEESEVLTRAAEFLTAEDWEAVRNAVPQGDDPLFGDHPEAHFQELRRRIAQENNTAVSP